MGKRMKGKMKLWMVLGALLCVLASAPVQARAASAKKEALQAYSQFLAAKQTPYFQEFSTGYVNNDAVPELVLENSLYTYKNGQVIRLGTWSGHGVYGYYKKKGIVVITYAHGNIYGESNEVYTYCKMGKTSTTDKLWKNYASLWKNNKKIAGKWNYFTAKGNKLSKSSFNKRLKKYVGSKKMTKFKKYRNTAANRVKYLK